jgi:hypothetical protein
MSFLRFSLLSISIACLFTGCSDGESVVVVEERSEAEIQKEMEDYDKQQAADAANYEKQNSGN